MDFELLDLFNLLWVILVFILNAQRDKNREINASLKAKEDKIIALEKRQQNCVDSEHVRQACEKVVSTCEKIINQRVEPVKVDVKEIQHDIKEVARSIDAAMREFDGKVHALAIDIAKVPRGRVSND